MVSRDFGRGIIILFLASLAAKNAVTILLLLSAQFVVSIMDALFNLATIAMLPISSKKKIF